MRKVSSVSKAPACNLGVFDAKQRREHAIVTRRVFGAVEQVRDLPNGLAFRLPTKIDLALQAAQFIMLEQLCCPFFDFTLRVESSGATWLRPTGGKGVKEFITPEFGIAKIKSPNHRRQK